VSSGLSRSLLSSSQDALDFVRVDDLSNIRILEEGSIESVSRFQLRRGVGRTV